MEFFVLRDRRGPSRPRRRPIVRHHVEQREGAAGCVPAPLLSSTTIRFSRRRHHAGDHRRPFPPASSSVWSRKRSSCSTRSAKYRALKKEAIDLGIARLAEAVDGGRHRAGDIAPSAIPKRLIPPLHGALNQERARRALVSSGLAFMARRERAADAACDWSLRRPPHSGRGLSNE